MHVRQCVKQWTVYLTTCLVQWLSDWLLCWLRAGSSFLDSLALTIDTLMLHQTSHLKHYFKYVWVQFSKNFYFHIVFYVERAPYQKILYFLVIIIHLCMKTEYAWHNALFINQIGYWRMFWIPIVSTTKSGGCSSIRRTKQRLKKLIYICEDSFFHLYERIYWKINCNEKIRRRLRRYNATS